MLEAVWTLGCRALFSVDGCSLLLRGVTWTLEACKAHAESKMFNNDVASVVCYVKLSFETVSRGTADASYKNKESDSCSDPSTTRFMASLKHSVSCDGIRYLVESPHVAPSVSPVVSLTHPPPSTRTPNVLSPHHLTATCNTSKTTSVTSASSSP